MTISEYLLKSNTKVFIKLVLMQYTLLFKEMSNNFKSLGIAASQAGESLLKLKS